MDAVAGDLAPSECMFELVDLALKAKRSAKLESYRRRRRAPV